MRTAKKMSCIIPVYNEQDNVYDMIKITAHIISHLVEEYEIIVVDDGSRDNSFMNASQAINEVPIKIIELSRNFGKEIAISAGLEHCDGDVAILIDCDFQHPPELIPDFYQKWQEGYDMAYAVRESRKNEKLSKKLYTKIFYWILNIGVKVKVPKNTQDYRILDRKVINAINSMPEKNRFMKGLFNWVGFKSIPLIVHTESRKSGKSSFNFSSLGRLGITAITAFSNMPLRIWVLAGFTVSLLSIFYGLYIFFDTIFFGIKTDGWPTLITAISFLGGIQLISIGILGEYIGRIFEEVKNRPRYFIKEIKTSASPIPKNKEMCHVCKNSLT